MWKYNLVYKWHKWRARRAEKALWDHLSILGIAYPDSKIEVTCDIYTYTIQGNKIKQVIRS